MREASTHSFRRDRRDRLLVAALPHIVFDGWGLPSLRAAARDLGLNDGAVQAAFPDPGRDSVAHFSDWADRRLLDQFEPSNLLKMKVRDRVALVLRTRLEVLEGNKEAVRRASGFLSLPTNHVVAARLVYRTVDEIWHLAGDEATDFNFYTKRGLLAAVLMSTTLFWLDDESEGHAESWAFLNRRIGDIMKIPRRQADLRQTMDRMMHPLWDFVRGRKSPKVDPCGVV